MKRIILSIILAVLCCSAGCSSSQAELSVTRSGRFVTISFFNSEILGAARSVRIYLPQSYDSSDESYPVVYMHDGQNIFRPGGYYGCWYMEDVYDDLVDAGTINELIIVGINNTSDRSNEYNLGGAGYVDRYARFIAEELVPYINENYRTLTGPEHTAVMGSSYGGNASLYCAWYHPDVFGMAACFSSALAWENETLLSAVSAYSGENPSVKFWIDAGDDEWGSTAYQRDEIAQYAYRLTELLLSKGWTFENNLLFEIQQGAIHHESAWNSRAYKPLTFFFGKSNSFEVENLQARILSATYYAGRMVDNPILLGKVTYANGIVSDLIAPYVSLSSAESGTYSLSNGEIVIDDSAVSNGQVIQFEASYGGKTSSANLTIVK